MPAPAAVDAQGRAWLEALEGAWEDQGTEGGLGVREAARQALAQWPVPHRRLERWRFTPLTGLLGRRLQPGGTTLPAGRAVACPDWKGYRLVIWNGRWVAELSQLPVGVGVEVRNARGGEGRKGLHGDAWMGAVLTRFAQEGLELRVADGVKLDGPILVESVVDGVDVAAFPTHRVVLGAQAQATLIEWSHAAGDTTGFAGSSWEWELGENAVGAWHQVVDDAGQVHRQCQLAAEQQAGSRLETVSVMVRAAHVRNDWTIRLTGEGAHARLLGAYLPTGDERVAHYTTVDHRVPNCTSDEDYRGVLYDRAQGVFNGKIFVRPDAQKTEAYQRNANLVVGREAVMHSKPELEIYADDVKCSHGCTIGQIDNQALFYAQSRGISEADARALLVEAFVGEVLRALPEGGVQEAVRKGWAARHGGFDNGEGWSDWTD